MAMIIYIQSIYKIRSQMIKSQIEHQGVEHEFCDIFLFPLSLSFISFFASDT